MATADAIDDALTDPWCDQCYDETNKKIEASGFCPECNIFICKSCLDAHKRFSATKKHEILQILQGGRLPKAQADRPVKYLGCDIHKGFVNEHFCMNHSKMVCSQCIIEFHMTCKQKLIPDLCTDLGTLDIQDFKNVTETIKNNLSSVKNNVEQNEANIRSRKTGMIKEAKELRDKLILNIENAYSRTLSDINKACDKKVSHLSNQVLALSDPKTSLDQTLSKIDKIIGIDITPHVFIQLQVMVANVRQIQTNLAEFEKQLCKVDLLFSVRSDISAIFSTNNPLGSVKENSSHLDLTLTMPTPEIAFPSAARKTNKSKTRDSMIARDKTDLVMPTPKKAFPSASASRTTNKSKTRTDRLARDIRQIKATKMTPLNVKMADDNETCYIQGMAVTRNNMLLLADWNNKKVKTFSRDNKLLSSLALSGHPYDVTMIDDSMAAVSTDAYELHILSITDLGSLTIQSSVSLGYGACDLALCNNNLAVIKWTEPRCVKSVTMSGSELWSVSTDHNSQQLFENPRFLTTSIVNDKLTVLVTDWGKETITLLDGNNGDVIKTVDMKRKGPLGLTSDNDGNVYVCCRWPGEICVWSADFSQNRVLLSGRDLQPKPTDIICCNNTDEIFICYHEVDTVDRFRLS